MPSFPDTAVLVILALLLFGPKKLPVLARQIGKLMADFRRASNEFRTQMEEELRISEQADRQKQVAAIEAAAPASPVIDTEPDQPHLPPPEPNFASAESDSHYDSEHTHEYTPDSPTDYPADSESNTIHTPLPIATSGDLNIMPPATGLPIASSSSPVNGSDAAATPAHQPELETETMHG